MESLRHLEAKERLEEIAVQCGFWYICSEIQLQETRIEYLGERTYTPDLLFEKDEKMYIFEADGKKGHSSKRDQDKDKLRDKILGGQGFTTIRIPVKDLIGRRKLSNQDIIKEIDWQIMTKTLGCKHTKHWSKEDLEKLRAIAIEREHKKILETLQCQRVE